MRRQRATRRVEDVLALDADVVIHTPRLGNTYSRQNEEVIRLLASGKNVISIAGFHYPPAHGAAYAAPLRAVCDSGNVRSRG